MFKYSLQRSEQLILENSFFTISIEEIKQHLLDDNMVVKKDTDRLIVKNYPN
jgi:hypothetical protein